MLNGPLKYIWYKINIINICVSILFLFNRQTNLRSITGSTHHLLPLPSMSVSSLSPRVSKLFISSLCSIFSLRRHRCTWPLLINGFAYKTVEVPLIGPPRSVPYSLLFQHKRLTQIVRLQNTAIDLFYCSLLCGPKPSARPNQDNYRGGITRHWICWE